MMLPAINTKGFTLVETIIYIGLFGILMAGIFSIVHPLFVNSQELTGDIAVEGDTAFILRKIEYALASSINTPTDIVDIVPNGSTPTNKLEINNPNRFAFELNGTNLMYREGSGAYRALNTDRVQILSFDVNHIIPTGKEQHYLTVKFTARRIEGDTITIGPVNYYLHF